MQEALIFAGIPWVVGGGNIESWHNALLLQKIGLQFHFSCPGKVHDESIRIAKEHDWSWSHYKPGDWDGKVVASWNNPRFLSELLNETSKPAKALFYNCMTVFHPAETWLCEQGRITHVGYVSDHQRKILAPHHPKAEDLKDYIPYFSDEPPDGIVMAEREGEGLVVGHISRDDPMKFPADLWRWVDEATEQIEGISFRFLGFGPNCRAFFGEPPENVKTIPPLGEHLQTFLSSVQCLWHQPGPAGESMARVVIEAMLSGAPVVCPKSHAFPEMVEEAVSGFLYEDRRGFIAALNTLKAIGGDGRRGMGWTARASARTRYSDVDRCAAMWRRILE